MNSKVDQQNNNDYIYTIDKKYIYHLNYHLEINDDISLG